MEIGKKIKTARNSAGLTQEQAAEALGVSRQTISNWENERSYPDITSVIKMSDLYSVSLNHLLKEETQVKQTYMEYLEESINTVKSREKLARLIIALATLTIWAVASAVFWMTIAGSNNGIYPLAIIWGILPVTTLTVSVIIGNNNYYGKLKWLAPVCFGILHMLSGYVSFDIGNSMMMKTVLWPGFRMFPIGAVISLIGLAVGVVIHSHKRKKTSEADEKTQVE